MKRHASIPLLAVMLASTGLHADVLEMKNGTILNGKYVGGSATTVRFDAFGSTQVLATSDLIALTFTSSGSAAAAPAANAPSAQPAPSAARTGPSAPGSSGII